MNRFPLTRFRPLPTQKNTNINRFATFQGLAMLVTKNLNCQPPQLQGRPAMLFKFPPQHKPLIGSQQMNMCPTVIATTQLEVSERGSNTLTTLSMIATEKASLALVQLLEEFIKKSPIFFILMIAPLRSIFTLSTINPLTLKTRQTYQTSQNLFTIELTDIHSPCTIKGFLFLSNIYTYYTSSPSSSNLLTQTLPSISYATPIEMNQPTITELHPRKCNLITTITLTLNFTENLVWYLFQARRSSMKNLPKLLAPLCPSPNRQTHFKQLYKTILNVLQQLRKERRIFC